MLRTTVIETITDVMYLQYCAFMQATFLVHFNGGASSSPLMGLNPQIMIHVAKVTSSNPSISIRDLTTKCPLKVGTNNMSRSLQALHYHNPYPKSVPLLSEKNHRIKWAKNVNNAWQHAVFPDEASIWLCRGCVRM